MVLNLVYEIKTYTITPEPLANQLGMSTMIGQEGFSQTLADMETAGEHYLVKTHELPTDDRPAIYLVRDGRDALVSYTKFLSYLALRGPRWKAGLRASVGLHQPQVLMKHLILPDIGRESWLLRLTHPALLLRGTVLPSLRMGGWSEHVQRWTGRSGPTYVVHFEHLIKDPATIVSEALKAIDWPAPSGMAESVPTFDELHAKWPEFFRRGKIGSWKDEMPEQLHRLFWRFQGEAMGQIGYSHDGLNAGIAPTKAREAPLSSSPPLT